MSGTERLDFADRWLRDGLRALTPALSVYQITVDMTAALSQLDALRREGVQATTTHLLVSAIAKSLARNPEIHQVVAGNRRHRPGRVDIGLSVAGDSFVAPILVIEDADRKTVTEIAAETSQRTPAVRQADAQLLTALRRWGWLVPFGALRRGLLRLLFRSPAFRVRGAGTFQVSSVPTDWGCSAAFSAAGVLVGGRISSQVVAVDGQPAVQPMMYLTLSADHGVWDGRSAALFLADVRSTLEAG